MADSNPKPQSGRFATHEDLELFMSLQEWLDATNPDRLGFHDAWAESNTDTAFAFNNEVGVQMSSESNRWVSGNDTLSRVKGLGMGLAALGTRVIPRDLSLDGRGLYVYISKGPYVIMELQDPVTTTQEVANFTDKNTSNQEKSFEWSYSKTSGISTSVSVTESTGLKVESKFEIDGFSFGVEASFDKSRTEENSQSSSITTAVTESTVIQPHTNFNYTVIEETTTTQTRYGLDFCIGSEVDKDGKVTGGIAKATGFRDPNKLLDKTYLTRWDRMVPIESIRNMEQTAQYNVTTHRTVTRIETSNPDQVHVVSERVVSKKGKAAA